ncbi:MAG: V-type ATP synthase subunit F [Planctomycetota bacterium]|nr:V-type ATP synthase subunit F [Planctomycetota bacterium]
MSNIAVVGDRDTVLCFKAIGVDVFPAGAADVRAVLDTVVRNKYSIVFLTENLSVHVKEELNDLRFRTLPSVVLIPSMEGSMGLALGGIREAVKKAVGSDLMGKRG